MESEVIIEKAKQRCKIATTQIESLQTPSKTTDSCQQTLFRLVNSELNFLSRTPPPTTISLNIGYIESILHILHHPLVSKVSRVCKPSNGAHIDVVCTLNRTPVWVLVSDRNPKCISWGHLKLRVERVLKAAKSSVRLKPVWVFLFFANGVDGGVDDLIVDEFGASEVGDLGFCVDWGNVIGRSYVKARVFQIRVDDSVVEDFGGNGGRVSTAEEAFNEENRCILGEKFCSLVLSMRLVVNSDVEREDLLGEDVLNFDTTALIAIVSGISNGGTEKLLATPESELRERFKGNYEFVIAQVMSELQNPILEELMCVVSGKIGLICESAHLEFRELVSMCGGPNEKLRADQLTKCLLIVPDSPSARMMDILTTRKIALKNKVIFGTGDQWLAPTLTANMGFVRAISQTGMSLLTLEHRPRALTGD